MRYLLLFLLAGCNSSKNATEDLIKVGECYYEHELGVSNGAIILQLGEVEVLYFPIIYSTIDKKLMIWNGETYLSRLGVFVNRFEFKRACP